MPDQGNHSNPSPKKSYSKKERLKHQSGFEFLLKHGKKFHGELIFARITFDFPEQYQTSRLMSAVSAPKRKFRKAVQRNRVKRQMREAWRQVCIPLKTSLKENRRNLVVWIMYKADGMPDFSVLANDMQRLNEWLLKRI